jgi:Ca2+-binding RTX toxin-like protein
LSGGEGGDVLTGGAGAGTFVFLPGAGSDAIRDFQDGFDRIDLSALDGIVSIADLAITRASASETRIGYCDGARVFELVIAHDPGAVIDAGDFVL